MKKKMIEDLRTDYKNVVGKEPAIRWNKKTLAKKILDAEILKAGHAARENKVEQPSETSLPNSEFEKLASDIPEKNISDAATSEQPYEDKRGGPRAGAGRPIGQTDERARIERLLSLDVPDLALSKIISAVGVAVGRLTGQGFTKDQVESIALGFTRELYYWFPAVEGKASKWTLHLQSADEILLPIHERMLLIHQINQEQENVGEKENTEVSEVKEESGKEENAKEVTGRKSVKRTKKKQNVKARSGCK